MPKYLTATLGNKDNLEWQLHHGELPKDGNGKAKGNYAFTQLLPNWEQHLSLSELIERYSNAASLKNV